MEIIKSASKLVFLIMTIATVVLTFMKIVEPKDFMILASMAFSFYFANKGSSEGNFLGK